MRFPLALVTLVALSTLAAAAPITAGQPEFNTLPSVVPTLSVATSNDLLRVPMLSDIALDERMIAASIIAADSGGGKIPVPEPAVFELCGLAAGFGAILFWHQRAIRKNRRRGYIRKRRSERAMSWI